MKCARLLTLALPAALLAGAVASAARADGGGVASSPEVRARAEELAREASRRYDEVMGLKRVAQAAPADKSSPAEPGGQAKTIPSWLSDWLAQSNSAYRSLVRRLFSGGEGSPAPDARPPASVVRRSQPAEPATGWDWLTRADKGFQAVMRKLSVEQPWGLARDIAEAKAAREKQAAAARAAAAAKAEQEKAAASAEARKRAEAVARANAAAEAKRKAAADKEKQAAIQAEQARKRAEAEARAKAEAAWLAALERRQAEDRKVAAAKAEQERRAAEAARAQQEKQAKEAAAAKAEQDRQRAAAVAKAEQEQRAAEAARAQEQARQHEKQAQEAAAAKAEQERRAAEAARAQQERQAKEVAAAKAEQERQEAQRRNAEARLKADQDRQRAADIAKAEQERHAAEAAQARQRQQEKQATQAADRAHQQAQAPQPHDMNVPTSGEDHAASPPATLPAPTGRTKVNTARPRAHDAKRRHKRPAHRRPHRRQAPQCSEFSEATPASRWSRARDDETGWGTAERHYGAGRLYPRISAANQRLVREPDVVWACLRLYIPPMRTG
jgi:nucleoid-associated protein YgaU